ncbi:hypothetical protein [Sediminibacterium goheungense]|uniref:Uncharacterized protein n=1 Tax=Sediminibacterium goheungense TaxID=1086393 RepID=A0A4R6J069_9BACT|nr:hypothetical protein [Sediminibacterium goheungense]TDO28572.1 hypothetical protein BC659_0648 [Sediminibacterium goheungense]
MSILLATKQYLKQLNITINEKYLRKKLLSHPNYPSLVSLTDFLVEHDMEYTAVVGDKNDLNNIPFPFLY